MFINSVAKIRRKAMRVRTPGKSYLTIMLLTMFSLLPDRICLADDAKVKQLIISMIEKFEEIADYTCSLDKRVRKNGILHKADVGSKLVIVLLS